MMMNFTQHVVSGLRTVSSLKNEGQLKHVLAMYHQDEVSSFERSSSWFLM